MMNIMVEDELITEVLRHAVVHADSSGKTPFQHALVHTLIDEMAGQLPLGTSEAVVRSAIQQGKETQRRTPPQKKG